MEILQVKVPGRTQGGMLVVFDNDEVYDLDEQQLQSYYQARLAYYVSGNSISEPRLKDYVIQHGMKVSVMETEILGLSLVKDAKVVVLPSSITPPDVIQAPVVNVVQKPIIQLYAIKNHEGKWLKKRGSGHTSWRGSWKGSTDDGVWVDELAKAKISVRLGQARAIITHYANSLPSYPLPVLVQLNVTGTVELDEAARLQKSKERKERVEKRREVLNRKRVLDSARAEFERAKAKYEAEAARLKSLEQAVN